MSRDTDRSFRSFRDMGSTGFGRPTFEDKRKMNSNRIDSPLVPAVCKYYKHDGSGFGFIYAHYEEGMVIPFNCVTADRDDSPGTRYTSGEKLDRPIVIEAFIHGSVVAKAGHRMGLEVDQQIKVRIKEDSKVPSRGLQAFWADPVAGNNSEQQNTKSVSNEPRVSNAFLAFVTGTVAQVPENGNYGVIITKFECESGNQFANDEEVEVSFDLDVLKFAKIDVNTLKVGDEMTFKYWVYSDQIARMTFARYKTEE